MVMQSLVVQNRARLLGVVLTILAALMALLVAGQHGSSRIEGRASSGGAGGCSRCNVILLLADTLRADRLPLYGYRRRTAPFLGRLASAAVVFERARSQASCTFPSVNSIFTSRYPSELQHTDIRPAIPSTLPTLAQILSRAGYRTAAISASPIVRSTPSPQNLRGGYDAGFDSFDESVLWAPAATVSETAVRYLRRRDEKPFFLYVHYMDPHDPYTPDTFAEGVFAAPYRGTTPEVAWGDANGIQAKLRVDGPSAISRADVDYLSARYDEAVLSLDRGLATLYQALEHEGLLDGTILVLASDHGEAFLEHGFVRHCTYVDDAQTWVPLIFRLPGRLGLGGRIGGPANNLDIVPTLLDYLEIDASPLTLRGRSLRPRIEGPAPEEQYFSFSAVNVFRAADDGRVQVIKDLARSEYRLVSLADGLEQGAMRATAATVRGALEDWLETYEGDLTEAERVLEAREIEEELRALGYIG